MTTLLRQHKSYKNQWVISFCDSKFTDNKIRWAVLYDNGKQTPPRLTRRAAYNAYDKNLMED